MGGLGSGEWDRWEAPKTTVEECYSLDVNRLAKDGLLYVGTTGAVHWTDPHTGEHVAAVRFSTILGEGGERVLRVSYRLNDSEDISIPIRLQTTCPNYGGRRWWFTCPLILGHVPCNRRVRKLYLPPGARYFGCRICHDLTYRSSQESHQLERLLAPERLERAEARLERLMARPDKRQSSGLGT